MRAMTWWDHETESIWSQPWGMAIDGPLAGTHLKMIPARMVPWEVWLEDNPDTLVLDPRANSLDSTRESFRSNYVIGIALGEDAKAYTFQQTSAAGVVNDRIGEYPIVVTADSDTKSVHVFLRRLGGQEMEFTLQDGNLVDAETGSSWDLARGIATSGPMQGSVLQRVPYITAFDWAWEDFYPHTLFYKP